MVFWKKENKYWRFVRWKRSSIYQPLFSCMYLHEAIRVEELFFTYPFSGFKKLLKKLIFFFLKKKLSWWNIICKKTQIPHANYQMCQLIVMCYVFTLLSLFGLSFALWPQKNLDLWLAKKIFVATVSLTTRIHISHHTVIT